MVKIINVKTKLHFCVKRAEVDFEQPVNELLQIEGRVLVLVQDCEQAFPEHPWELCVLEGEKTLTSKNVNLSIRLESAILELSARDFHQIKLP